jgi:signal transduction histidine kinase
LPPGQVGATIRSETANREARAYLDEVEQWVPHPASAPEPRSDTTDTILLIDDNADMRAYVSDLLRQQWTVEVAATGLEALDMLARRTPDLVLSDVMMPDLDGFALLHQLRSKPATRQVPIILMSARAGEAATVQGLEGGADDYLVKPFSARELLARVSAQLRMQQIRRQAQEALEATVQDRTRALQERTTELERANHRLLELERMKSEFLASMSHELRTPLNAIIGFSELMREFSPEELTGPDVAEYLEHIHRSGVLLLHLIGDILDLARIESGRLQLHRQTFNLQGVLRQAADLVAARAELKNIALVLPESSVTVVADRTRMTQVLINLLTNAVKFTPDRGTVQVLFQHQPDYLVVQVADTGVGIPEADQERIFQPFEQISGSVGDESGTGLGLTISRRLVEAHGGSLTVESRPRHGSTFTVRLPQ